MNKVFGIGWAKTGTTSLGSAFKVLGFDHRSQDLGLVKHVREGDLSRIIDVARSKESFEDWPWIILYRELDEAFPDSRFVLTTRKPERWLRSYRNMLAGQGRTSKELIEIRRTLYGLPFPDVPDSQLLERFLGHNAEVMRYFHNRRENLLIVDWEKGDGWAELCGFLGRNIPDEPFPHANRGKYVGESALGRL